MGLEARIAYLLIYELPSIKLRCKWLMNIHRNAGQMSREELEY